jgi:hypothetical protein
MNAFLTGSHVYGTPHEKSDIDLVVMMTPDQLRRFVELIQDGEGDGDIRYDGVEAGACVRFGKLNLIVVTSKFDYQAWQTGTGELALRKPVTRDEACATFKVKREEAAAKRQAEVDALDALIAECLVGGDIEGRPS